jgi:CheY-like chemotaxis protein
MGGKIWAKSVLNQGSTFHFTFYAPPSLPPEVLFSRVEEDLSEEDIKGVHVLLVEDNPINQLLAKKLLERMGLIADLAVNGELAVEMVIQNAHQLILMDMQMPVMDGLTATRHIRALKHIDQPYIIALTANAFAEDQQACLESGMNDFLSKPIQFDLLQGAIKKGIRTLRYPT